MRSSGLGHEPGHAISHFVVGEGQLGVGSEEGNNIIVGDGRPGLLGEGHHDGRVPPLIVRGQHAQGHRRLAPLADALERFVDG